MTGARRRSPLRRGVQLSISIVVGAACLWLAFRGLQGGDDGGTTSLAQLGALLRGFSPMASAQFFMLFLLQVIVRTERWRVQVRGLTGRAPAWRDALSINAVAFAALFLLPFRLGELVRPNLCAQRGIMRASEGLAATALERVLDGLVTTAMFGVLLVVSPYHFPDEVRVGGLSALVLFGGAVAFLIVAFRVRDPVVAVVERVVGVASAALAARVPSTLRSFLQGLACFRGPGDVLTYVALSLAYWLLNGLSMHVIVDAIVPGTSPFAGFLCVCFLVIGVMLPAPPGNVGNFHAFAKLGLTAAGVAPLPAVAAAVVLHALTTIGVVVWGAIFMLLDHVNVRAATHEIDGDDAPRGDDASRGAPIR